MLKYEYVKQQNETECGAACIASICRYYHVKADMEDIRDLASVDKYGANFLGLQEACEKIGFQAEGLKGNLEELMEANISVPFIAHVVIDDKLEHFIVIWDVSQDRIIATDPAKGHIKYTLPEFEKIWTGHILTVSPVNLKKYSRHKRYYLIGFFPLVFEYKKEFILISFISVITVVLNIGTTFFLSHLIDSIIPNQLIDVLMYGYVIIIAIHALVTLVGLFRIKMIAYLTEAMNQNLMYNYIQHLLYAKYDVYEKHTTGDFTSRMQDIDTVRNAVSEIVTTLFLDVLMMIAGLIVLKTISIKLFVLSMFSMFLYGITVACFNKPVSGITTEFRHQDAVLNSEIIETINSVEVIKAYCSEQLWIEKCKRKIDSFLFAYKKGISLFSAQAILSEGMISIIEISILSYGGIQVIQNGISMGSLILFYTLFSLCIAPVKNIIDLLPIIHKAEVAAKRLKEIMDVPQEAMEIDNTSLDLLKQKIVFDNVCFRYGNRSLVLDNLSLIIYPGETIAIIGNSGSGKSTLAKLLLHIHEISDGALKIGQYDLSDIPLPVLRNQIAYISQDGGLIQGSVLDNIKIGNPNLSETEILNILKESSMFSCIEDLPAGYQTILTEKGKNLSGGQRQIVGIGRALIKRANILILDEATSALDGETLQKVNTALKSVYQNATVIIITHQLAAIKDCERIAIIDNGKIEMIGTPHEMMKQSLKYRNLFQYDMGYNL